MTITYQQYNSTTKNFESDSIFATNFEGQKVTNQYGREEIYCFAHGYEGSQHLPNFQLEIVPDDYTFGHVEEFPFLGRLPDYD